MVDSEKWLPLVLLGVAGLHVMARRRAPRCAHCQRALSKGAFYCSGCGAPVSDTAPPRRSAPTDVASILRRVLRPVWIYLGGFVPLWALVLGGAVPPWLALPLCAFYAVAGALACGVVYVRLSRCGACQRVVPLNHDPAWSAAYCCHCGNTLSNKA